MSADIRRYIRLHRIRSVFNLAKCAEAKDVHVWRPEELFEVFVVVKLLLNLANGVCNAVNSISSVNLLHLFNLSLVVENWILEDLLYVLLRNFRRRITWRSEMLPTINR